jgi:hypothetical protein
MGVANLLEQVRMLCFDTSGWHDQRLLWDRMIIAGDCNRKNRLSSVRRFTADTRRSLAGQSGSVALRIRRRGGRDRYGGTGLPIGRECCDVRDVMVKPWGAVEQLLLAAGSGPEQLDVTIQQVEAGAYGGCDCR